MLDDGVGSCYRRLAAAILEQAARDAQKDDHCGAKARAWLECDPMVGALLDAVEIDRSRATAWLEELPPVTQPVLL